MGASDIQYLPSWEEGESAALSDWVAEANRLLARLAAVGIAPNGAKQALSVWDGEQLLGEISPEELPLLLEKVCLLRQLLANVQARDMPGVGVQTLN